MSKKRRNINNISDKIQKKKEIVLNSKSEKKFSRTHIIAVGIIVIASVIAVMLNQDNNSTQKIGKATPETTRMEMVNQTQNDAKEITYDESQFNDRKVKYYQYQHGKILIKYFILKSSDGKIRSAFDACDVCWSEGKGYAQDGDEMICKNCGQRFASIKINELKGGCNPSPLDNTVQNGKVIIKTGDIIKGSQYFDFSKRS